MNPILGTLLLPHSDLELRRFIHEGNLISEANRDENVKLLNSRSEWGNRGSLGLDSCEYSAL